MGLLKHKVEGGSGGRRGHSNMNHIVTTEEIKAATKKHRRSQAKRVIREALGERDVRI